jgi:hypothetical protein
LDVDVIFNPRPDGADAPVEGFYSLDRRGKVALPVRIWFGPPVDLEADGETLDRSPRWQMMVGDRLIDDATRETDWDLTWDDVWPQAAKSPIPESEYRYRCARIAHAKSGAAAKSDPWARRTGKIDLLTAPIPE